MAFHLEGVDTDEESPLGHAGLLKYDDGGARGLAACLCWLALVTLNEQGEVSEDELKLASNIAMIRSLLCMPAMYKQAEEDPTASMIKRIVKQNVDSKKLPVSSYEWSCILRRLQDSEGGSVSMSKAIDFYNNCAEVRAHGTETERSAGNMFCVRGLDFHIPCAQG